MAVPIDDICDTYLPVPERRVFWEPVSTQEWHDDLIYNKTGLDTYP